MIVLLPILYIDGVGCMLHVSKSCGQGGAV